MNTLFNPKTIAVIGANSIENTVGNGLAKNILISNKEIYFVNPFENEIEGKKPYNSILDIEAKIDLVILATPAKTIPAVIDECIKKKVGSIVIISAGFGEYSEEGLKIQQDIANKLKRANISLVGPNCLGIINANNNLNASFAPAIPNKGDIALISQSGALIDAIIGATLTENFGLSKVVSLGNEAGLDISDFIEYLDTDDETKVIGVYVESIKNGKKFVQTCQKARKPIVVLKAGKHEAGKKAASTHTGSLAGDYQIYKAAFKKAGVIEVETIKELLNVCKTASWQPILEGDLAIITNGGGYGVLAADYAQEEKVQLAKLEEKTIQEITNSPGMHPAWSKSNPLDIVGDATSERYKNALETSLKQKDIKKVLIIQTTQIMTGPQDNAQVIIEASKKYPDKQIICCFLGGKLTQDGIDHLEQHKIPNFLEIQEAIRVIKLTA